jgi:hypothetical protein
MLMQIGNCRKYLPHNIGSLGFGQELLLDDEVKELSTITDFSDQVNGLLGFIDFVEFDDVGVVEFLEDLDLGGEHLLVSHVLL